MDIELIKKYGTLNIEELLTKLEIIREALNKISQHPGVKGNSFKIEHEVKRIADKAKKDAGFPEDIE